jgi:hypothetical protein
VYDFLQNHINFSQIQKTPIDVDYLCKYVKQISIENHPKEYKTKSSLRFIRPLQKFEKCFLLFKRDTRFFLDSTADKYGNAKTEFQLPKSYKLDLNLFDDEDYAKFIKNCKGIELRGKNMKNWKIVCDNY